MTRGSRRPPTAGGLDPADGRLVGKASYSVPAGCAGTADAAPPRWLDLCVGSEAGGWEDQPIVVLLPPQA